MDGSDHSHLEIHALLRSMVEKQASDLFITVGTPPSFKIHGRLVPVDRDALTAERAHTLIYSLLTDEQRAVFERAHECNFALSPADVGRFRVNIFQQQYNVGMVVRRIETRIPTIDELSLPPILKDIVTGERGLVLLVGATGSGKSTTLAAMIGHRNRHGAGHIISIEDPIEFVHTPETCIITQREVGTDTDSYENALKNALRQAPNVVYIGEVRSRETMEHAITFADTGHLCLTTLHAKNASQALDRIVNLFPRDRRDQLLMDLSLNLKAIIAQRLVPSAAGGRRVAMEILVNTPLIADLILRGEIHLLKDVIKNSGHYGMKTFDQAVYDLFREGMINAEDAVQHADSATDVRLMIRLGADGKIDDLTASISDYTLVEPELQTGTDLHRHS